MNSSKYLHLSESFASIQGARLAELLARTVRKGDCLEFTGAKHPKGYGIVRFGKRCMNAHRAVAILAGKATLKTPCVRHICDNRPCINPDHLIAGTVADNNRDRAKRGRSAVGEKSGSHVLTAKQVLWVRNNYKLGNGVTLANKLGVSYQTIYDIINGKYWKHL